VKVVTNTSDKRMTRPLEFWIGRAAVADKEGKGTSGADCVGELLVASVDWHAKSERL
jgi:hypothetical protein